MLFTSATTHLECTLLRIRLFPFPSVFHYGYREHVCCGLYLQEMVETASITTTLDQRSSSLLFPTGLLDRGCSTIRAERTLVTGVSYEPSFALWFWVALRRCLIAFRMPLSRWVAVRINSACWVALVFWPTVQTTVDRT